MIDRRPIPGARGYGAALRISGPILRFGCRSRSSFLVALAWALATSPIDLHVADARRPAATASGFRGRIRRPRRIVVLPKAGGTEDFRDAVDAADASGDVELWALPRDHVKVVFRAIVGGATFPTLTDTDYRAGDPNVEPDKLRYRRFLTRVVRRYARIRRVVCIGTSNMTFRAERELAGACVDAGVGFVALHKESIRTAAQRRYFTRAYAELLGPFIGSAIGVYNAEERASIVEASTLRSDRVKVVGCPRMDRLHRVRLDRAGRLLDPDAPVVLFAVDVQAGTWTPYDSREAVVAPRWERLSRLTDEAFIAAARSMPDRRFIVKAKIGRERQQLGRLPSDAPSNLSVESSGIGTALLEQAAVVVGFNSTVLLEALAAGVPTLVPRYAEAEGAAAEDWMLRLAGAVREVSAPEDLVREIRLALERGPSLELTPSATAALERYVGNADGRASERAWALLRENLSP